MTFNRNNSQLIQRGRVSDVLKRSDPLKGKGKPNIRFFESINFVYKIQSNTIYPMILIRNVIRGNTFANERLKNKNNIANHTRR